MAAILTTTVEGAHYLGVNGMPANIEFTLVVEPLAVDPENPDPGELSAVSEFADLTEASWTGYARVSKARPAPTDGAYVITSNVSFSTDAATDGPADVRTLAAIVPTTNEILALWDVDHYLSGPTPVALNMANAVVTFTQPIELFLAPLTAVS